jgi:hypothetical protein
VINVIPVPYFPDVFEISRDYYDSCFCVCKDERCVNFVSYFESKLWSHLIMHLLLVVVMYAQCFFTFDTFPYATRFESWANVTTTFGRG